MRYIESGGTAAWNALVYGEQNPMNLSYFQSQLQSVANNLTDQAKSFYRDAQQIYDKFTNSDAMRAVRNAIKGAATLFNNEVIQSLFDVEDMQTASFRMQRWIMANPVVREMYHNQRCDGYSDTYIDTHPGKIGDQHYDYRRVMDGVAFSNEDGDDVYKIYCEDIYEGDRELTIFEKSDILTTWEIVEMIMKNGAQDPTNPFGGSL